MRMFCSSKKAAKAGPYLPPYYNLMSSNRQDLEKVYTHGLCKNRYRAVVRLVGGELKVSCQCL